LKQIFVETASLVFLTDKSSLTESSISMPAKSKPPVPVLMHLQSSTQLADLRAAKAAFSSRYLRAVARPSGFRAFALAASASPEQNVVGVGIGEKIDGDMPTGIMAVKFFVRRKYAENELSKSELLPKTIDGLPVDVEQTGFFRAFAVPNKKKTTGAGVIPNPKMRYRPAQPGSSIGFQFPPPSNMVMAGTFGAVVKDAAGTYILSNNHVLADEGKLPPGAPIFQPGLLDGGNANVDKVATLTRFIPLNPGVNNKVDGAIAKGINATILSKNILHIGAPAGAAPAMIDMRVHKFGRTTSYTVGRIISVATDVTVGYEAGNITFADQIIIVGGQGSFSAAGDSGSLILERQTNKAVGLLFAGSASHTIANHIADVLQALNVTLA
jgi:hypothetical protein